MTPKTGDDGAQPDEPREVEMKLAVAAEAVERVANQPLLRNLPQAADKGGSLEAVYFDTPDQDLRRAGLSLRVRREAGGWIQTLKADGGAQGLVLDRSEWETVAAGPSLDWSALAGTPLHDLLKENKRLKNRLQPAFTVRTERQVFLVQRARTKIELALDRAEILAGERTHRFGEIELEVKRGTPAPLFDLALELADGAPVRLSLETKSGRGYALLDGQAPKPVKAERIALRPGMSSAEAFQAVARSCLRQAVRNEAIVREHGAPEAIHQFRVGLRRLRAAASLFGDLLGDDESRAIRAELRWINHSLGPVRDLDVLLGRLREAADQDPSVQAAERRREEAFAELIARMDEPRFRRASLAAAGWIEAGRWLRARSAPLRAGRDQPIEERAADELSRRWKRVTKRAKRVDELEPEARHEVRIEIKKLRYGVEFFGSLFTGKRAKDRRKKVLALLEQFQEVLGELNDLAVGGNLLAPAPATGVARSAQPDEDGLLRRAKDISRGLAAAKRFWR